MAPPKPFTGNGLLKKANELGGASRETQSRAGEAEKALRSNGTCSAPRAAACFGLGGDPDALAHRVKAVDARRRAPTKRPEVLIRARPWAVAGHSVWRGRRLQGGRLRMA